MDKKLQDFVWSILPKEFKEEVKETYREYTKKIATKIEPEYRINGYIAAQTELELLFGIHNLTSDTDGEEEMLCVSRKRVQKMWQTFREVEDRLGNVSQYSIAANDLYYTKGEMSVLDILFGSKCLPDVANEVNFASKEPNTAEPKFRDGDKFRYKKNPGEVYTVDHITNDDKVFYWDKDEDGMSQANVVNPEYIELYTEPEDLNKRSSTCTDDCPSPGKESSQMKPITSKVSVYLDTKEEDEEFRQLLHENGFEWISGDSLTDLSLWESDIESTKIHFAHPDKTVTYEGDITSYFLTFSEFKKRYFGEPDTSHKTPVCENHSDNTSQKEVNLNSNRNHRQFIVNYDKQFDNILKDNFRNERRLNIATRMMQALVCAPLIPGVDPNPPAKNLAKTAFRLADALLAECEKGGMK